MYTTHIIRTCVCTYIHTKELSGKEMAYIHTDIHTYTQTHTHRHTKSTWETNSTLLLNHMRILKTLSRHIQNHSALREMSPSPQHISTHLYVLPLSYRRANLQVSHLRIHQPFFLLMYEQRVSYDPEYPGFARIGCRIIITRTPGVGRTHRTPGVGRPGVGRTHRTPGVGRTHRAPGVGRTNRAPGIGRIYRAPGVARIYSGCTLFGCLMCLRRR